MLYASVYSSFILQFVGGFALVVGTAQPHRPPAMCHSYAYVR